MAERMDLTGPLPSSTTVVEASAGTGKTYVLATLATRYLAEGCPLERLTVITFSRAATSELRSRIGDRLDEAVRFLHGHDDSHDPLAIWLGQLSPSERSVADQRLQRAQRHFEEMSISTTHEFCDRMLHHLGTLAETPADSTFVADATQLATEVARDHYLAVFADDAKPSLGWEAAAKIAHRSTTELDADICQTPSGSDLGAARTEFAVFTRDEVERRKALANIRTYDDKLTSLLAALDDPNTGAAARERVREACEVLLVDEFQDTDPTQWRILRQCFHGHRPLVLIGDPKQAIYSFRGADIYTYLEARDEADEVVTLNQNFRSDGPLVAACSRLLGNAQLGEERIQVIDVVAARHASSLWGDDAAPLRIRVPDGTDLVPISTARARIEADLGADIARTLSGGLRLDYGNGPRPVEPGDIAVLVTTNNAGARIRDQLTARGIPASFAGANSVLATTASHEWLLVLTALTTRSSRDLRRAATTNLLGLTLHDVGSAQALAALEFQRRRWQQLLASHGPLAVFQAISASQSLGERLLRHTDGERLMTDFAHIAGVIESASRDGVAWTELAAWLAEATRDARRELPRRLETQAETVNVMTIHRSKGLQFPLVYLPYAAERWSRDERELTEVVCHDPARQRRVLNVDASNADFPRHVHLSSQQDLGEDLRKFYVALTRARSRVTMWWFPTAQHVAGSALHRILHHDRTTGHVAEQYPRDASPADLPLAAAEGIAVETITVDTTATAPKNHADLTELVPKLRTATAPIDHEWRRTSYSGLTAGAQHDVAAGRDESEVLVDQPSPSCTTPSAFGTLPGGTGFGTLVHAIFERVSTDTDNLTDEVSRVVGEQVSLLPTAGVTTPELAHGVLAALRTPLGPLANGLALADIASRDRLPELDFDLPMGGEARATLGDLCRAMSTHLPPGDAFAAYPERLRASLTEDGNSIVAQTLAGYLTGSIDALLRVGDRHIVVDYKTNRLTPPDVDPIIGHYHPGALAEAMMASHYPLQALLYCVATHRFLRWRLANYDPDRHLGGSLYLFVRGMAGPETGPRIGYGVCEWAVPTPLVCAVSDALAGRL